MNRIEEAKTLRKLLEHVTENLDDSVALEVATFVKRWKPNTDYAVGDRVSYKPGEEVEVWKCRQAHTSQEEWAPSTATASLWERIEETHTGTVDDPIPYNINLAVFEGLYYTEDNVLYICTRDSGNPLYATAASLIGNYFEVVTGHEVEPEEPTPEPEPQPNPIEPTPEPEPQEPVESAPAEWEQKTYMIGDKVTFNGNVYESVIDNNVWSPTDYPAGWQLV